MELFVKQELLKLLPGLDALLLDIDGVLLDVSGSFRQVITGATQEFATRFLNLQDTGPLLELGDVELFKLAGGFNDDWELCCAAVALVVAKWAQTNATDTQTVRDAEPSWVDYTRELKRRRNASAETTGLGGRGSVHPGAT
jgi:phosphoglycolate phosphatase-like HAD superfamily hydrolase